jgi:hypothetical protein
MSDGVPLGMRWPSRWRYARLDVWSGAEGRCRVTVAGR